jgi:dGTPase
MPMEWEHLLTSQRFGKPTAEVVDVHAIRTEFQRDYDRIIFSSPFRRLQNKTQVFPLPGSIFVHNRLTHSLEVASIGRSLGNIVTRELKSTVNQSIWPLIDEIGTMYSGKLSSRFGEPSIWPFGGRCHFRVFSEGNGQYLQNKVSEAQWNDLVHFEGNANALRLLTHTFHGRRQGGYVMTYATLSALVKYPFSSGDRTKKDKYGYFQTEKEVFAQIARQTGLTVIDSEKGIYARNPLVYLVEAADDIAYLVMDIEDAHKLGILSEKETKEILNNFFTGSEREKFLEKQIAVFQEVTDINEQIAYLRASAINRLVHEVADVFVQNIDTIMNGCFEGSLIKHLPGELKQSMETSGQLSKQKFTRTARWLRWR